MKIGLLFGGRSYEREISIITAAEAAAVLKTFAEIYPIYAENGEFYLLKGDFTIESFDKLRRKKVFFGKHKGLGAIISGTKSLIPDCIMMCCHGGEGENGAFSALMEICDLPYTAASATPSGVTMDKRLTKIIAERNGFATPKSVWGHRGDDLPEKAKSLEYPMQWRITSRN